MMMTTKIKEMLLQDEGYRQHPYRDTEGVLTIGVGRNLDQVGITRDEAMMLLHNDIEKIMDDMQRNAPWVFELNEARQVALINMAFNLGIVRFMNFRKMHAALKEKDFDTAAKELLDSRYATQVPNRATRLAFIVEVGRMS